MSTQRDRLSMIPALKPLTTRDHLALLHFLWLGVSGLGAAKLGWGMVSGPRATLSDFSVGVLLCLAPLAITGVWVLCLIGVAQHHQIF
ncbi:hypothetical protein [Stenotrophomonas sp. NPDC077461]|uniref:hypothetical protein n=1 Tax=Stenotrophomonas sp. NPDC077461 TaxID=3414698 RepID=UPI003C2B71D4